MGNRYRRIVTLGMISFTALLAWGYCMLAYRSETLYVAIISLVLVASCYALALAVVEMKDKKEIAMQQYVANLLQESVKGQDYTDVLETLERLAKASYVQQRKVNTYLGQQNEIVTDVMQGHTQAQTESFARLEEQMDEALTKAVKILVKYNQSSSDKQFEATKEFNAGMSEELTELTMAVGKITAVLQQMTMEIGYLKDAVQAAPQMTVQAAPQMSYVKDEAVSAVEPVMEAISEAEPVMEAIPEAEPIMEAASETEPEEEMPDMEAILASLEKATEDVAEEPESEELSASDEQPVSDELPASDEQPVSEEQPEQEATFNAEDFFAQFGGAEDASLKEEAAFKEEAMEQVVENNGMLDQSMIDALLNNLSAPDTKEEPLADVIPFPQAAEDEAAGANIDSAEAQEQKTEATDDAETAGAPQLDGDPNRQLTPEEIAALFASMQ